MDNEGSKFDFIMSWRKTGTKLPSQIVLKDVQPGESPMMSKRRNPCALRFHKFKIQNDPVRFILHEVMLYYPLRNEVAPEDVQGLYDESFMGARKVDLVKAQVMEFLESVTEARYYAEEAKKELELDAIAEELDAQGHQENEEFEEEGMELHPEHLACHPGISFFLLFIWDAYVLQLCCKYTAHVLPLCYIII